MEGWLVRSAAVRRALLLVLLGGVPLVFLRSASDPINAPKLALLLGGLSIVAGLRLVEILYGGRSGSLKRLLAPVLFVVIPLVLSWIAAPYRGWSLFGEFGRFQGLIPYVALALFGLLLADAFGGRVQQVAWTMAASGALVAGYGLIQRAGWDPFTWYQLEAEYSQATSTLGNTNYVGGFLAITLPICLGLALRRRPRRALAVVLVLVTLGGLVVSFSQGGWAAAAGGSMFLLLFVMGARWRGFRVLAGLSAFLAGIVVSGVVVLTMLIPSAPFLSQTIFVRAWDWQAAAGMASTYPLLGRGPNAFAVEGVQFRPIANGIRFGYFFTDQPHSVWFSVLTAAGVVGIVGFLLLLLWVVRKASETPSDSILRVSFIGAASAYFIQSLVSIDELSLRIAFWGALAGMVAARQEKDEDVYRSRNHAGWQTGIAAAAIGVVTLVGVFWSTKFLIADIKVARGVELFEEGEVSEAKAKFDSALAFRDEYRYRHLLGARLGRAALRDPASRDLLLPEMDQAFGYLDSFPHVIGLRDHASYLRALASEDDALNDRAVDLLKRAQRLDRVNPMIRVDLADILLDRGDEDEAYRRLSPLIYVFPQFSEYWGALALAEARTGRFEDARASIELAFYFDPGEQRAHQAAVLLPSES